MDPIAPTTWTLGELLAWTQRRFAAVGLDSPRADAEHLLAHALGCTRLSLYVRHDEVVDDDARARFREAVRRRLQREPVAYIEGRRGFHALDLELVVDPRVLIPRPETEHLVDWVLEDLPPTHAEVLDVGTGSGAIALAIAGARPDVRVVGSDVSTQALEVARANADRIGRAIELVHADLLTGIPAPPAGWSAIAANLPYVATDEIDTLQPEVRAFEPRLALDGGPDGLSLVRRLVQAASEPGVLAHGAALYLEIGHDQSATALAILRDHGFVDLATRKDWNAIPRVLRARRG